jgi:hypothetical protein
MDCKPCEKLKAKMQSKSNLIYMGNSNDMVTITNGTQTRKCSRAYFEQYCQKTWKIVEETPTEESKSEETEETKEETKEETEETEVKNKKKK